MILTFNSLADLARAADCPSDETRADMADYDLHQWEGTKASAYNAWHGGMDWQSLLRTVYNGGQETNVQQARQVFEKIEAQLQMGKPCWEPSIAGAYPMVPEYLMGVPENMRVKRHVQSDTAPIKIWVPVTCSAGLDAKTLVPRGTALLALAMALTNAGRTVELSVCSFGGSNRHKEVVVAAKLCTTPLSLAETSFALCHTGVVRALMYGLKHHYGFNGCWPSEYDYGRGADSKYLKALAIRAGVDFIAPPAELGDADQIKADPVAWLNKKLGGISRFFETED